jgi:hypothetical protein
MVVVAPSVWDRWRDLESRFAEPAIALLFTSELTNQEASIVLRKAARSAVESLEAEIARLTDPAERQSGRWSLASVPGGIVLRIDEEPDSLEELLGRIVQGLDTQGVSGRFDLYESAEPAALPETIDLVECRLRVNGSRYHKGSNNYGWRPQWAALWHTVEVSLDWCTAIAPSPPLSLRVDLISSTLTREDDVASYVRDGLEETRELGLVCLTSTSNDRFRTVAVCASRGRVSLIEGGDFGASGWRPPSQTLCDLLVTTSELLVYGFVKRGTNRSAAERATSQIQDWPRIPHFNAWNLNAESFEDEFVPDAFGAQMLGPGYEGRVPTGPSWRSSATGLGRVVLEHVDPAAWFEAPLPSGAKPGQPAPEKAPIPEVLLAARRDFASILFRDEIM